ncbi:MULTISPECIES: DUF2339 domain-containing protein [unclassified Nitrospina]|uniref:DUF2339 domain-containing protein n=1 Tax=unclassified Nitrospina TaxID=2638683 RepID=UPI003F9A6DAE
MAEDNQKKLLDIIKRLDQRVADLNRRVQKLEAQLDDPWFRPEDLGSEETPPPFTSSQTGTPPPPTLPRKDEVSQGEFWLNKIGIALLLMGLAFLFKYSLDQDWMTPPVRILMGGLLGGILLALGIYLRESREILSPVLQGGGLATFYMTVFAAFQLYALIPHLYAFSVMVGITLFAFTLAVRQYEFALALVAVTGGLSTPFLLHQEAGSLPGLVLYTCLVLAGSMAVYYFRPWRSLLWYSWAGGWVVLGIAEGELPAFKVERVFQFWSVEGGVLFAFALFWIVPLLTKQRQWYPSTTEKPAGPKTVFENTFAEHNAPVTALMVFSGILAWLVSYLIWDLPDERWGQILLAFCLPFFGVAFALWRRGPPLEPVALHATMGVFLLTLALWHLFDNNLLFFAFGVEATALHWFGKRTREHVVTYTGTVFLMLLTIWLCTRILGRAPETAVLNWRAGADLAFLLLAAYWSTLLPRKEESQAYLLVAYVGWIGWLWRELNVLPHGSAWVSIGWGLTGAILLLAGVRTKQINAFRVGLGTLVLVAVKLTLFDLSHLSALWRILIFMGFGAAFLWISYWMKSPWTQPASGKAT